MRPVLDPDHAEAVLDQTELVLKDPRVQGKDLLLKRLRLAGLPEDVVNRLAGLSESMIRSGLSAEILHFRGVIGEASGARITTPARRESLRPQYPIDHELQQVSRNFMSVDDMQRALEALEGLEISIPPDEVARLRSLQPATLSKAHKTGILALKKNARGDRDPIVLQIPAELIVNGTRMPLTLKTMATIMQLQARLDKKQPKLTVKQYDTWRPRDLHHELGDASLRNVFSGELKAWTIEGLKKGDAKTLMGPGHELTEDVLVAMAFIQMLKDEEPLAGTGSLNFLATASTGELRRFALTNIVYGGVAPEFQVQDNRWKDIPAAEGACYTIPAPGVRSYAQESAQLEARPDPVPRQLSHGPADSVFAFLLEGADPRGVSGSTQPSPRHLETRSVTPAPRLAMSSRTTHPTPVPSRETVIDVEVEEVPVRGGAVRPVAKPVVTPSKPITKNPGTGLVLRPNGAPVEETSIPALLDKLASSREGRARIRAEVLDADGRCVAIPSDPHYKYLRIHHLYREARIFVNGREAVFANGVAGWTYYYADQAGDANRKRVMFKTGDVIGLTRGSAMLVDKETGLAPKRR